MMDIMLLMAILFAMVMSIVALVGIGAVLRLVGMGILGTTLICTLFAIMLGSSYSNILHYFFTGTFP